jgi:hypothetical protein
MKPPTDPVFTVKLQHRNGGTSVRADLTLNEAREFAARSYMQGKAAAATITDSAGVCVGLYGDV